MSTFDNVLLEQRPAIPPQIGQWDTVPFANWLDLTIVPRVQASAQVVTTISAADQHASIPITALVDNANGGLYRIEVYSRVTVQDNVGSTLQTTIQFTDGSQACTQVGQNMNSNDKTKPLADTFIVRADGGTLISYTTAYTTTGGAPAMRFDIELSVEPL